MGENKGSLDYASGEKFLELARLDEEVFREHVEEYKKQVFAEDKIKVLEQALEYATRAIELYKKGIRAREDRENVYNELKAVLSNGTNQRYKILLFLAAVDRPVTISQITKTVFGDEKRISTVAANINVLDKLGIVSVDGGKAKSVVMDQKFRDVLISGLKATFLQALEEVCGRADSSA